MILCDTNIFISALNNRQNIIEKMQNIGYDNIAISTITVMELFRGMDNKQQLNKMRKYLQYYDIVQITEQISEKAIELIYDFHLSHNLQIPDAIIGATAIEYNIPLFTYNLKDFRFMPEIKLYNNE